MPNISPHTFIKGWDRDTDFGYLSNESYIDAANLRLTSISGNTKGALENIIGNSAWSIEVLGTDYELREALSDAIVLNSSNWYLIGSVNVLDTLILFISENITDPTAGGNNWIVKIEYDNDEITSITKLYTSTSLNFARSYPIKAVSRYERSDIQKIYWVDGYNSIRYANIADPNLSSQSVDKFDILPNVSFGVILSPEEIAGTIPAGRIQYAYQFYDEYGSETPYSFLSHLFNIVPEEGSVGGGLRFSIYGLDTNFDKIKVIALYYNTLNTIPTIRIVYDGKITGTTQYFSDTGYSLGELTYEEVAIFGNTDLIASEVAIKNNYLFVANTEEDFYDELYDVRAYRFESGVSAKAKLYESDLSTNIEVDSSNWSTFDSVSATNPNGTHDCINLYNDPDNAASNQYKFQSDGSTLGAEGPNVQIGVDATTNIDIDTVGSTGMYVSGDEYGSIEATAKWVGYKRGEVYRFAAILINEKGQRSPAKWICDFKMPTFADGANYNVADYDSVNDKTTTNILSLLFNFRNVPASVKAIEIVRAKREAQDRSRIAQGIVSYMLTYTQGSFNNLFGNLTPVSNLGSVTGTGVTFFSPEVSFGNNVSYSVGDKFSLEGILTEISLWDKTNISYDTDLNRSYVYKYKEAGAAADPTDEMDIDGALRITPYSVYSGFDIDTTITSYDIGTISDYYHIGAGYDGADTEFALLGTSLVCDTDATGFPSLSTNLGTSGSGGYFENYLADYVKNVFDSQYLGPDLSSRLNNEYISTGTFVLPGGLGLSYTSTYTFPTNVYGGDTFINMFDCLYGMYPSDTSITNTDRAFTNIYFPVESSINLALREDEPFGAIYDQDGAYLIKEQPGLYSTDGGDEFEFDEVLYQYNTVYSQENLGYQYFSTNNYDLDEEYTTRVYVSDKKFNGEVTDSWTKFRANNYIDVDSQYGEIVNLEFHFNELLFWQKKAFGILPVEQRSLINDNSPGTLVLGTGDVLGRYDYLSIDVGNQSKFGIIKAENGIYWYDRYNTAIYRYSGSLQPINKLKGLDSYFETDVDYDVTMVGVYDYKYNDVILSFIKNQFTTGEFVQRCILFNELFDTFVCRLNTDPVYFIQLYDKRYIGVDGTFYKFYEYNTGNYCEFEGITYDSTVTLVDNVSYPQKKVYDNIEYFSKSTDAIGANIFDDTFYKLKIYNDYQNTAEWTLQVDTTKDNSSRILPVERRERNFTLAIPRNALTVSQTSNPIVTSGTLNTTQLFAERIRSNYIVIQFKYDNSNNYKFSVPFINVIYRISSR